MVRMRVANGCEGRSESLCRRVVAWVVRPIPALSVFGALWVAYLFVLHPWLMNWGATLAERAMALPGDTAAPSTYFTRAITIDAPPDAVWPWLMAIGQDRAGFLSYDWLENLAGGDIHNARTLRPEWQTRAVGDRVPMAGTAGRRLLGDFTLLTIRLIEPERVAADLPGRFVLMPQGEHTTRLLLREPLDAGGGFSPAWLVWDPMHFVMEQRMLRGIKERTEGRPLVPSAVELAARAGWAVAGIACAAAFLDRRRWRWLLLPIGAALVPLALTGDVNSALAAFLAVGITVLAVLVLGRHWWPPYLLLASAVALVLLLAPDAYAAFGLIFLLAGAAHAVTLRARRAFSRAPGTAN